MDYLTAFDQFLDSDTFDRFESYLYDISLQSFKAGFEYAKGEHNAPVIQLPSGAPEQP